MNLDICATFDYAGTVNPGPHKDGKIANFGYGLLVSMWGDEVQMTIAVSPMQSGRIDAVLVHCQVDNPIRTVSLSLPEGSTVQSRIDGFMRQVSDKAAELLGEYVVPGSREIIRNTILCCLANDPAL